MSQNKQQSPQEQPGIANQQKDPEQWVTGDEPMTGAQMSYLKTLHEQTGDTFDATLTKADASRRIDELRHETGVDTKADKHNA